MSHAEFCPQDESLECVSKYTITQADVDSGTRTNTAHVTSTSPDGTTTLGSQGNTVDVLGSATVTIGEASSEHTVSATSCTYCWCVAGSQGWNLELQDTSIRQARVKIGYLFSHKRATQVVRFSGSLLPCLGLIHTGAAGSWSDGDDKNGYANVGEEITCTYEIENAGTQTLSEFCLVDDNVGTTCVCEEGDVSPGGGFFCSTTFKVSSSSAIIISRGVFQDD